MLCGDLGPNYETAAEIQMLRTIGADAVSMSTVPEVLVARQRDIRVLGIALIANMGTGLDSGKLSHKEVTEMAEKVKPKFTMLLQELIDKI